jgi:uncharacterized protein YneF (UPF0154 family)
MLDDKPELEPWSQTLWFVIRDPKGVTSGRLRAKLEWKPVVAVHDDSLLDATLAETAAGRRVLEARRKEKLKEMWKKVDEDKSGALDADEIHAVLLLMGRKENEIKINHVMKAIDKDGSGTVDFAEFEIWWDLQGEDKQAAFQENLEAEPEPEPEVGPTLVSGTIKVTVLEADKLKKMDRMGKNDPYVVLRVPTWNGAREVWNEGVARQTSTIPGGGMAPKWGYGQGETFMFREALKIPKRIEFKCMDEDEVRRG